MREAGVAHVVKLVTRDLAIALQRVEHIAVLAVEALIDLECAGAKLGQVRLDHRARSIRPSVQDLDGAGDVAGRGVERDRARHRARLDLFERGAAAHGRKAFLNDLVRRL